MFLLFLLTFANGTSFPPIFHDSCEFFIRPILKLFRILLSVSFPSRNVFVFIRYEDVTDFHLPYIKILRFAAVGFLLFLGVGEGTGKLCKWY